MPGAGDNVFRTPEDRFADLPAEFASWEPQYLDWSGIRLARIDEGEGKPVVLFHGEPTWSLLWRKVIPPLLEAGHRCIAPDLPGFGRSDKPTDFDWYSYDRHAEAAAWVLEQLDVRDATFVVHDWGGPVGLRVAAENPERCARLVVMDTGVFDGNQRMSDAWLKFRDFVQRTEDLPISMLVRGACATDPGDEIAAAYDAPFPTPQSKAGARAFPLMLPTAPDAPGAEAGGRAAKVIAERDLPSLCLWADGDPIIPIAVGRRLAERLGLTAPVEISGASHFLQEDQGAEIGRHIAAWLEEQR
ncbi:MAG: alpha/beta fold hydrolase [Solirubrobacterales bacterium]|nr:alpha/beta fold hydrolase [Solirubrobacterales bacterium]MCB8970928.1 alpha/beta fold hydrolase [Thermoleophilales bacterium]MCO5326176.1 haloalkane dehalogenase [Solirubrobacterales bacterium]